MEYCDKCQSIYQNLTAHNKPIKGVFKIRPPGSNHLYLIKNDFTDTPDGIHKKVKYAAYHSFSGTFTEPLKDNSDVIQVTRKFSVGIACQALANVLVQQV